MQIKDLPSTSSVASTDVLAKDTSGGTTNKLAISDFVINNLTSTSTTKALSAAQGKALNAKFGGITFNFVNLPANTQKTITVSDSARCFLFFCSGYSSNCGIGALAHYGQGQSDGVFWLSQATGITINVSTNNSIKITANQAAVLGIMAIAGTYTPQ